MDDDFKLDIPVDPLPGESLEDASFRYFREQGILVGDDEDNLMVNFARANEIDPNIAKFFAAGQQAEFATVIDQLELDGWIYSSVDSEGRLVYGITEEGKRHLDNTKDN
jgi:hypothetical protein